jgi:hypothetical protein
VTETQTVDLAAHFYGEDRAMADETACSVCGWPLESADPECGHEGGADD